jgi:hypothetical protein
LFISVPPLAGAPGATSALALATGAGTVTVADADVFGVPACFPHPDNASAVHASDVARFTIAEVS